ncbi:acetyltransferase [Croceivirga radicis]|uniref:acetyltransferase n=1 Tax=Croceivirga radicis TaxID=1929488 RepID=UPI000255B2BF|nr:acetyltransferase [Croceivirga radicis]
MKKVRIYGAGGHSQVIRKVLELNDIEVTDTYDDKPSTVHSAYQNTNIASGARDGKDAFPHEGDPVIIAVGNNLQRAEIAEFLKSEYEKAIHPSSIIAESATVGEGTVVFAGAIIQPNTTVGKHVIVNTAASIDHDNSIGDYAHISPKVALCGHVEVGEGSHVGVGAVVIPKIKIGKWCTIGAGTVVIKDVPDYATVVGNPGRIIKTQNPFVSQ